jgi:hypothetical protein
VTNPGDSEGICICDFPKVRVESSFTCENECPTGKILDQATVMCVQDPTRGASDEAETDIYFTLEGKLPIFNAVSPAREMVGDIYADSCNPPYALG